MSLLTNANDILIDLNGHKAYLENDKLWVYNTDDGSTSTAVLIFNNTDLGEPGVDKLLNEFIFDYKGSWIAGIFNGDNGAHQFSLTLSDPGSRAFRKIFVPLNKRKAFKRFFMIFTSTDNSAALYGIEIDFQILKQRSYA